MLMAVFFTTIVICSVVLGVLDYKHKQHAANPYRNRRANTRR